MFPSAHFAGTTKILHGFSLLQFYADTLHTAYPALPQNLPDLALGIQSGILFVLPADTDHCSNTKHF